MRTAKHIFFWLSGASTEGLEQCPTWEQRKYVAFGATVLVPMIFAFIAAAYAVSTLTESWFFILTIAAAWSFIILSIDRALLATYRSFQPFFKRIGQFLLRFVVAILMGLTISHPLTLLLFKDTISSVVEADRDAEIVKVQEAADVDKSAVEGRVTGVEADIAVQRQRWDESFNAAFLIEDGSAGRDDPTGEMSDAAKTAMAAQVAEETGPQRERLTALDGELGTLTTGYGKIQEDLDFWQREFEREVNGQRSGIVGVGPRAKSIRDDQLAWRRLEAERMAGLLQTMTTQRNVISEEVAEIQANVLGEFSAAAQVQAAKILAERDRVAGLKRQVQTEQAGMFAGQQQSLRDAITGQIDTRLADLTRLQNELTQLSVDEQNRVAALRAEPRRDLLTQTLALHGLFLAGEEGGTFALSAYIVLALLFMLVDTIPIIVKFFSKHGPYDNLVDCDETRSDRERDTFLSSYNRYMDNLGDSQLPHLSRTRPVEVALSDGMDRSRAAKEFLEHLLELERAFQGRIRTEREELVAVGDEKSKQRIEVLDDISKTFYDDMRTRMASFFDAGTSASPEFS
ncbi:MAG: hypothetical protein ACI8UO_005795 [Verrucomicrobiales bacterium]|jgi:hypothetical protein